MAFLNSTIPLLESTLRVSTPLLFAALGGVLCERSGVINIALEGLMLVGAFAGAAIATHLQTAGWDAAAVPWMGALGAIVAGVALAAIYGFSVITLRADQIVAGTALNMFAAGLTPFLAKIFFGSSSSTPSIPAEYRFHLVPIIAAWVLALLVAAGLRYLPLGMWIRFAGEKPEALDSTGISVNRVRWFAVLTSGALAGLGGATLSIALSSSFSRNMTAGRGFMALAALIFGKWKPMPAAFACLLFGFSDAIQIRLQGVVLWGTDPVPVQFIQILPYLVTMVVLAGWVGHSRAPRALGLPFRKG
jgi:simple sugar transport system permease protein